jgi:hypothetical protein
VVEVLSRFLKWWTAFVSTGLKRPSRMMPEASVRVLIPVPWPSVVSRYLPDRRSIS